MTAYGTKKGEQLGRSPKSHSEDCHRIIGKKSKMVKDLKRWKKNEKSCEQVQVPEVHSSFPPEKYEKLSLVE